MNASIDLLKEQVKQLNGEVEQFTKEIEQLYDRYYFEEEDKKAQRLKTQIDEMREDRKRLTDNREALMTQLKAGDQEVLSQLENLQALTDVFGELQFVNFTYTAGKITQRSTAFSHGIKAAYGAVEGNKCWCLLTNAKLPYSTVIGVHLFKNEWSHQVHILGLDDIDDLRNGLPLWKPLEWAFDTSRLVLLYNKKDDLFRAKILDPNIQDVKLADKGSELGNWKPPASHLTNLKFRDVDGECLQFAPHNFHRPFRRCLNFQARQARREAIRQGWIMPQWDFEAFYSEGMSGAEKIVKWFQSMDHQAADACDGPATSSASAGSLRDDWSDVLSSDSTQ